MMLEKAFLFWRHSVFKVTASDVLKSHNQIAPGFDLLRIFLALGVLLWHSGDICSGKGALYRAREIHEFGRMILPMFFCLSGFLVTGSAVRLESLRTFMVFRLLRIAPALVVEVTLSAIILGGVLTTLPINVYYNHPGFYAYFGNIIGHITFFLPGVFEKNYDSAVNINLWTLPAEFYSYAIMALMIVFGLVYRRKIFLWLFFAASIGFFLSLPAVDIFWGRAPVTQWSIFWRGGPVSTWILIYCFALGSVAFLYREYIPISIYLFIPSLVFSLWLFSFDEKITAFPALLMATYCTVYLGMMKFPRLPILHRGDYSYGVYLYSFPLTQALWYYIPALRSCWSLAIAAPIVTLAFAILSWHLIERPSLKLKRFFLKQKTS